MERRKTPFEVAESVKHAADVEDSSVRKQLLLRQRSNKSVFKKIPLNTSSAAHPLSYGDTLHKKPDSSLPTNGGVYNPAPIIVHDLPLTEGPVEVKKPPTMLFTPKVRRNSTPLNPYARPVTALEVRDIYSEQTKSRASPNGGISQVADKPSLYVQRNSFLRPIILSTKTESSKQSQNNSVPHSQITQPPVSSGSTSIVKQSIHSKMLQSKFYFSSTTATAHLDVTSNKPNVSHMGLSSPQLVTDLTKQSKECSKPTVVKIHKLINENSSMEIKQEGPLNYEPLIAGTPSKINVIPEDQHQIRNKVKTGNYIHFKRMPVTNTMTGNVNFRKPARDNHRNISNDVNFNNKGKTDVMQKSLPDSTSEMSQNSHPSTLDEVARPMSSGKNSYAVFERPITRHHLLSVTKDKKTLINIQNSSLKGEAHGSEFIISRPSSDPAHYVTIPLHKLPKHSKVPEQEHLFKLTNLKSELTKIEQRSQVDGGLPKSAEVSEQKNITPYQRNDKDEISDEEDFEDSIEGESDNQECITDKEDESGTSEECSEISPSSEKIPGDEEKNENFNDEDDFELFEDNTSEIGSETYSITSTGSSGHTSIGGSVLSASYKCGTERNESLQSNSSSTVVYRSPFNYSIFHNIPPTLNFVGEGERTEQIPWHLRKLMKWKISPITPLVVKTALSRIGFRVSRKNYDWLGCFGKHMKAQCFKQLREYQKLNHFPGSFNIGRKDRLWRSLSKMQAHFGKREFNFFPQTFVLPSDLKLLKRTWEEGNSKQKWIIKPPASARGIGIRVISKWSQIPRRKPVVVQKYIHRPFLINGSKFDMRVYVYVSSYDPLRLYVYDDGLARFASCKYSSSTKSLNNRFVHLTNYSVNKKNTDYVSNSNQDDNMCEGHKWSLKALWAYMKKQGINTAVIWASIRDLIIKTIISGDAPINSMTKANVRSRYSCHELFGFDILLDDKLKPWILEVNISPSLHSNSPLDVAVKGGMIKDMMNIAGYRLPDDRDVRLNGVSTADTSCYSPPNKFCMDKRLFTNQISPDERGKHAYFCQKHQDEEIMQSILDVLTPGDIRHLCESIDEDSRKGNFQRLFPTPQTHRYLRFFEQPRYYNLLLDQWVLRYNHMEQKGIMLLQSLCEANIHLDNPTSNPRHQWTAPHSHAAISIKSPDMKSIAQQSATRTSGSVAALPKLVTKKVATKSGQGLSPSIRADSLTSLSSSVLTRTSSSTTTMSNPSR